MDAFDDLLSSSRRALEDNPFEDPFAKSRSNSPDPWASTWTQSAVHDGFGDQSTSLSTSGGPDTGVLKTGPEEESTGPLDLTSVSSEADDVPLAESTVTSPRTPGFRESAPSPPPQEPEHTSEPVQDDVSAEKTPPVSTARLTGTQSFTGPQMTEARSESPASPPHKSPPPTQTSTSIISPPPPSYRTVVSPLEQPSHSAAASSNSFASLALGGESFGGGWNDGMQASFVNQRSALASTERNAVDEDDDEDDDRPILQTLKSADRGASTSSAPGTSAVKSDKEIQPVFTISVEDPQKVGDPIRGYTMYTVHTRTTSPLFSKSTFSVLRRYSDFLWLYETLSDNNPGVVVPPVPEKSPFNRFDESFVEQRRLALEKCINKIANHAVLGKDSDLRLFLESDTFSLDIKHRKAEIAHERGGLIASIGQSLAGPKFYETDEWFDRQKTYLDSLESQLRGLVKSIDAVAKQRAGGIELLKIYTMSTVIGEFAQTMSDLTSSDIGKQLTQSLMAMADVERKAQDLQNMQANQDIATILSTVDEYARMINSVRLAFASRVRTYHTWQNAEGEVRRVKQNHEKNRSQSKVPGDRMGQSLGLIAEAERRALDAKQDFEKASRLIKSEMARFEQERIEDFKSSLQEFLEGMISRQQELIRAWEMYQQSLLKKASGARRDSTAVPVAA
ncbi:Vps5-domain-containing protein [Neolentinus lepideus HHB14362 ss-1]|uniref:Vps5-domain-containing protein n=1 Tax=Neolentinus lepideus HHB14362 ss-1 TaxID=1314782 RepID=A0A165NTJ7_9AGAM|nr:Vps5-domain-containing protein [Neolentinus lepideus HHB14362 ss-1]